MSAVAFEVDICLADSFAATLPACPRWTSPDGDSEAFMISFPHSVGCGGIGVSVSRAGTEIARYTVGYYHGDTCPFTLSLLRALDEDDHSGTVDACPVQEAGGFMHSMAFPGHVELSDLRPSRLIREAVAL